MGIFKYWTLYILCIFSYPDTAASAKGLFSMFDNLQVEIFVIYLTQCMKFILKIKHALCGTCFY